MPASEVAVVGGGVIGCAVAYYLAQAGARVAVFERDTVGCEASGAAAGMLAPLSEAHGPGPFLDLCLASLRLFPALSEGLRQETGIDIEYTASGLLRLAFTEAEEAEINGRWDWQRSLEMERLSGEEVRALEPALSSKIRCALYSPVEHQVNAGRLVQAL